MRRVDLETQLCLLTDELRQSERKINGLTNQCAKWKTAWDDEAKAHSDTLTKLYNLENERSEELREAIKKAEKAEDAEWLASAKLTLMQEAAKLPDYFEHAPACPKCGHADLQQTHIQASDPSVDGGLFGCRYTGRYEHIMWACGTCGCPLPPTRVLGAAR